MTSLGVTDRYLTARQAAAALGISVGTLYAYVSRGLVRSEAVAGHPRVKRYLKEDIARLVERKEFRKDPAKAAARGLHWGSPVLESALTLIDKGKLFYRGMDAIKLAREARVEEVAALLWVGDRNQSAHLFAAVDPSMPAGLGDLFTRTRHLGPIERCQLALTVAESADLAAYDLRPPAVAKTGVRILRSLFGAVCGLSVPGAIDAGLVEAWIPKRKSAAPVLRAALILCADHELNVSAFTGRCIASARATPYEVVIGALAAFRGTRHGGASEAVEAIFREGEQTRQHGKLLARRLRLSGGVPGFGHRLYPAGDPRAAVLISLARAYGREYRVKLADSLIRAAQSVTGEYPNLDFGLVTVAYALDLPCNSAVALFALGRTVGWIAHAIEQYADNQLIRPRARYTGVAPDTESQAPSI